MRVSVADSLIDPLTSWKPPQRKKRVDRPGNGPPGDGQSAGISAETGSRRLRRTVGLEQRGGAGEAASPHFP